MEILRHTELPKNNMNTSFIKQKINFKTSAQKLYNLLLDEELYSEFAGSPVSVSSDPNGTFEVFDGYCSGYNLELIPGKKIVQAWNFQEDGWPEDHYSKCTFEFKDDAKGGCVLYFSQTDIPAHKVHSLSEGWNTYYWEPMKKLIASI